MTKLKKPLFSLSSQGSLGKVISFVKRGGRSIAEKKPEVPDAKTLAQLSWRHMYQKAVALWHALSVAEKQEWESLARPKHMTGFAWFVSQALKPNPGLYLPLQGGKMAGDIDMDGNKIENLPDPTADQEPATKKYHDDNLPPGGYTQGCQLQTTADITVPTSTYYYIAFDNVIYDTDNMHSPTVNPDRITCKTAGIYLFVFQGAFEQNAVGYRRCYLRQNAFYAFQTREDTTVNNRHCFNVTCIYKMVVNQYMRVLVWQSSGGDLTLEGGLSYSPVFSAQRIG